MQRDYSDADAKTRQWHFACIHGRISLVDISERRIVNSTLTAPCLNIRTYLLTYLLIGLLWFMMC